MLPATQYLLRQTWRLSVTVATGKVSIIVYAMVNFSRIKFLQTFPELRRESRRLENEIDTKLVSFGKLSSSFLRRESRYIQIRKNQECCIIVACALISSGAHPVVGNPGHVFETMCLEIEQLLKKVGVCVCVYVCVRACVHARAPVCTHVRLCACCVCHYDCVCMCVTVCFHSLSPIAS